MSHSEHSTKEIFL